MSIEVLYHTIQARDWSKFVFFIVVPKHKYEITNNLLPDVDDDDDEKDDNEQALGDIREPFKTSDG